MKNKPADGHDGSVVKNGDDKDEDSGEVPVVGEGKDGEREHNAHSHTHSIRRVVLHPLKDLATLANGVHHHGKTGLRHHNIRCCEDTLILTL